MFQRRCAVNEDKPDTATLLASLFGLITTLLAALNQYFRFRQREVQEEEQKQWHELSEEIDELEDRMDEQEAMLSALSQKEDA
jgi:hypothetical protein